MRIACDIDGCINNLVDKTLEMYNAETGKNIQISDITAYNFYDCLPKDDADGIIRLFQRKDLWDSLSPAHKHHGNRPFRHTTAQGFCQGTRSP